MSDPDRGQGKRGPDKRKRATGHAGGARPNSGGAREGAGRPKLSAKVSPSSVVAIPVLRAVHGMSQATLAKKSGLTRNFLSLLETGDRGSSEETEERLAIALGVSIEGYRRLASMSRGEILNLLDSEEQALGAEEVAMESGQVEAADAGLRTWTQEYPHSEEVEEVLDELRALGEANEATKSAIALLCSAWGLRDAHRAALAEAEKRGEVRGFAEGIKAAEGVAREMRADIVVRAGRAQKQGATQIAQRLEVHADHVHSVEKKLAALTPESTPRLYTEEEVAERVREERERCLKICDAHSFEPTPRDTYEEGQADAAHQIAATITSGEEP